MDSLRITLILIGVAVIALIFFWERIKQRKRESRYERWGGVSEDGRETRIVGNRSGDPETDSSLVATAYQHDEQYDVEIPDTAGEAEQVEVRQWQEEVDSSLYDEEPDLDSDPEAEQYDPVPDLTSELEALEDIISDEDNQDEQIEFGNLDVSAQEDMQGSEEVIAEPESAPVPPTEPERIIAMHVLAHGSETFSGPDILNTLIHVGMQFGDMDIFHRLDEQGKPIFSLANAIEPGIFDMAAMDELTTPALLLIMTLPNSCQPLEAFDMMLDTARTLTDSLNGRLCDDRRSVLTKQAIEEIRRKLSTTM